MGRGVEQYRFGRWGTAIAFSTVFLLGGCQKYHSKLDADPVTTASTNDPSFKRTSELADRWKTNPKDVTIGLAYAASLGQLGQSEQQLEVYQALVRINPNDMKVRTAYGRALLAAGQSSDAIQMLEPVASSGQADWKLLSALGLAYDQDGDYPKARAMYQKALSLDPKNIRVLNNLGMSYAVSGDLPQAEKILKEALALPDAKKTPQVRQNLALVVGLQGRFDESREIASADLPPEQVEANLTYLQKMLSQPNTWKQLATDPSG